MKVLGKFLQLAGLIILPLAIVMQLGGVLVRIGLDQMIFMMVAGVTAFYLGRYIEGYAGGD